MKLFVKFAFAVMLTFCSVGFVSAQGKSTKLKITYKPKPGYTKEARQNLISGDVVLRVEFKADKTIGEISVVEEKTDAKMKKFGLVEEAIKAAKEIKFIPATENDIAVTQTKIIIMGFRQY